MCGIAGLLTWPGRPLPPGTLDLLVNSVFHRGPDSQGTFCDAESGVYLGHRRLAIVDLSPAGAQPMTSASGRFVIVLNGEIYNFQKLRTELDSISRVQWTGSSDTEVVLAAWEAWGPVGALTRFEGMFALAVWDRQEATLTLARDRFGEKPLYVGRIANGLAFCSELRGIEQLPDFNRTEDEEAVDQFLAMSYIPEPRTVYSDAEKLPAGCLATIRPGDDKINPAVYWSATEIALSARTAHVRSGESDEAVIARIEQRLIEAVRQQMLADVPLGAFLSGGIDSSLIVAMMQEHSARPVRTFTIGFEDDAYNEAPFARRVAQHLGTDHTEVTLDWKQAIDLVERLPQIYDEPFADSSQLATHLVSAIARQHVTVCLSGDAGDEVFGGYNRHVFAADYAKLLERVPKAVRAPVGRALAFLGQPRFAPVVRRLQSMSGGLAPRLLSEKLEKLGSAMAAPSDLELYISLIRRDGGLIPGSLVGDEIRAAAATLREGGLHLAEVMMMLDTLTYLPGDILTKVDRASMSVSLETRAPYLDHELFALAWRLPIQSRIQKGSSKSVLRRMLMNRVPAELFDRPKAGFGVPIEAWLRGPLRTWAEDALHRFTQNTPRHAAAARHAWSDLTAGRAHVHHFIWNIVMLQAWRDASSKA